MTTLPPPSYTSFDGHRRIAGGSLASNALAVKQALAAGSLSPVLIFDDDTGRTVDVDLRGTDEDIVSRLCAPASTRSSTDAEQDGAEAFVPHVLQVGSADEPRGRGRPKLGVVAREVTLLPRHWEWLAAQPGGASVMLRKLVEQAKRASVEKDRTRKAQERAYHFLAAIAGDLPGFEEASRALFAHDAATFSTRMRAWPGDVHDHALRLAFGTDGPGDSAQVG